MDASANANKEIMDVERDKYVRLAVFEATLAAIRLSEMRKGPRQPQRLAAQQTTEACGDRLGRHRRRQCDSKRYDGDVRRGIGGVEQGGRYRVGHAGQRDRDG